MFGYAWLAVLLIELLVVLVEPADELAAVAA
jgi:hypothetical protein